MNATISLNLSLLLKNKGSCASILDHPSYFFFLIVKTGEKQFQLKFPHARYFKIFLSFLNNYNELGNGIPFTERLGIEML